MSWRSTLEKDLKKIGTMWRSWLKTVCRGGAVLPDVLLAWDGLRLGAN
jgi:hypothetical protein